MALKDFNAFNYVTELKEVGMPEEQAQVQARALIQVIDSTSATKQDLEIVKIELKRDIRDIHLKIEYVKSSLAKDIEQLRSDLAKEIEQLRSDLTKDIEQLRSDFKKDMEMMKHKFVKSVFIMLSGLGGVIFAMAKLGLLSIQ